MERTIYLQHYRVCLRSDGTPRELSRDGAAITYEAVDERSREPVDLKLIPLQTSIRIYPGNWRSRRAPRRTCVTSTLPRSSILDAKAEILFASQSICQAKRSRRGSPLMARCRQMPLCEWPSKS